MRAALALLLAACADAPRTCDVRLSVPDPGGGGENVLFVLLDEVGVDQVAAYEARPDPPALPTLDALADEGVRFTRAYADPSCSPTRASVLTGRRSWRTGVGTWIQPADEDAPSLADEETTLPEVLADVGYTSALVGKWHLTALSDEDPARAPLRQGFAHHRGLFGNPNMMVERDGQGSYDRWERLDDGVRSISEEYLTTAQVDDARDLAATLPEPWFLMLSSSAAHSPWGVPPADLATLPAGETTMAQRYTATLQAFDAELGRLLAGLDPAVRARTTILVMGDNGSPPEVILPPLDPGRAKNTLYEGGIRVPLLVAGPRVGTPGSHTDALVHAVDVFATVADLAGADPGEVDGRSFLGAVEDPGGEGRECTLVEEFGPDLPLASAVIGDRYKLVREGAAEALYQLGSGAWDEGDDLLGGALDGEAERELRRLRRELGRYDRELR